jgi:S-adenosylmethionine:tRNA ribosyltransferase-isomerase
VRLSDFDFELPEEAIAHYPTARRDGSRLMVVRRAEGRFEHRRFEELPELLHPKDLLVVNDSKVLKGRLQTHKAGTGGRVELLLVEPVEGLRWRAMAVGAKALRPGMALVVAEGLAPLVVAAVEGDGFVQLDLPMPAEVLAEGFGALPLPPYMRRDAEPSDEERYQTIFAQDDRAGSVAAPTAGLHFTPELLARLAARGISKVTVTLHVGPGTFLPVRAERVEDHVMHAERFEVPSGTVEQLAATRRAGGRVVAVGTTATRVLESRGGAVMAGAGSTDLFIQPGFPFKVVDALITNFHLPRSTLLMLVAAFAGRDLVLDAYRAAVREGYRFYSYGDAMLIA